MSPGDPLRKVHLPAAFEPVYLPTCASALQDVTQRARSGAPEGTLVWAGEQTDGRGRFRSRWLSPYGGLYCAVVLRPELAIARVGELIPLATVALGTALAELVSPLTDLRYRWPNAIILGGGRAGGAWLAVGKDWLALAASANVVTSAETDGIPYASISFDGGNPEVTVAAMLEAFARQLATWLARWDEEGFEPVIRHFCSRAPSQGAAVSLCLPGGSDVTGQVEAIAADGSLRLSTDGGARTIGINEYMGLPAA